jgi:hypothetical protein
MLVYGELEYDKPQDHRQDAAILRLASLVEIQPDDDGGPYDADVTVELEDGTRATRSASQAPRSLLFHDRPTSTALIEQRTATAGRPAGTGTRMAQALFAGLDGSGSIGSREFLRMAGRRH